VIHKPLILHKARKSLHKAVHTSLVPSLLFPNAFSLKNCTLMSQFGSEYIRVYLRDAGAPPHIYHWHPHVWAMIINNWLINRPRSRSWWSYHSPFKGIWSIMIMITRHDPIKIENLIKFGRPLKSRYMLSTNEKEVVLFGQLDLSLWTINVIQQSPSAPMLTKKEKREILLSQNGEAKRKSVCISTSIGASNHPISTSL
jgi:hypothetical protein